MNVSISNVELAELGESELGSFVAKFNTVILTEVADLTLATRINKACRENGVAFLYADVLGLFAWSFSDFGADFVVADADGEEYQEAYIANVAVRETDGRSVIDVLDRKFHDLEDGDFVKFFEMKGIIPN